MVAFKQVSLSLLSSLLLLGCGGGGGSNSPSQAPESETTPSADPSDTNGSSSDDLSENHDNADPAPTGTEDLLEIAIYEPGPIEHQDAAAVARTIVSALNRRIQNRVSLDEGRIGIPTPGYPEGTQTTIEDCTLNGQSTLIVDASSQLIDGYDIHTRVFTEGDQISFEYEECQGYLSPENLEVFDGTGTTHFLSGYANNEGEIYGDSASYEREYERMSYLFEPLVEPNYQHGSILFTYDETTHELSGAFYAQRVAILNHVENTATADDTLIDQITTNMADFRWTVTEGGPAELTGSGWLGSNLLDSSFETTVSTPLRRGTSTDTHWAFEIVKAGSITARGTTGTLQIDFYPDHISYRADDDGDQDFESSGDLFWSQILPDK